MTHLPHMFSLTVLAHTSRICFPRNETCNPHRFDHSSTRLSRRRYLLYIVNRHSFCTQQQQTSGEDYPPQDNYPTSGYLLCLGGARINQPT